MATNSEATDAAAVARAYFEAVGRRDLDAMTAFYKPGAPDEIYGLVELRVPDDLPGLVRQPLPRLPGLQLRDPRRGVGRREGSGALARHRHLQRHGAFRRARPQRRPRQHPGLRRARPSATAAIVSATTPTSTAPNWRGQLGALPPAGSAAERAMTARAQPGRRASPEALRSSAAAEAGRTASVRLEPVEADRPQADRRADRGPAGAVPQPHRRARPRPTSGAVKVMPNGVPSSFQENDPWPVYIERGEGSRVWDVDGNEYVDFHNGFGVMCIGHANPDRRRRGQGAGRRGHPLRRPDRRLDRRRRGAEAAASACPSGASTTPAPRRRWTPSTSPAAPPAAT